MSLSESMLELVARRFRLLGEPIRIRILQVLESGERTVSEIVDALEANQSNISKHLGILHDGGLVGRRKQGNSIYYSIADPVIFKLCELVCRSATSDIRSRFAEIEKAQATARARRKGVL